MEETLEDLASSKEYEEIVEKVRIILYVHYLVGPNWPSFSGLRTHKRVYPKAPIPKSASTEKRMYRKARIPKSTT
jgi:hypothetical protein